MSFYFLPVKINNRRYFTIQLRKNRKEEQPYNFIIRNDFSEDIFSIYNSCGKSISEGITVFANNGEDINAGISISAESAGTLTLNLTQLPNGEKLPSPTIGNGIRIASVVDKVTGLKALRFSGNTHEGTKCLHVVIKLSIDGSEYSGNCKFYFSNASYETVHKIFDFGSEASQIATIFTEDNKYTHFLQKTVRNFAKLSGVNDYEENGATHTFYQEEVNSNSIDPHLYLSKFFLRRENSRLTIKDQSLLFKNNLDDTTMGNAEGVHPIIDYLTPVSSSKLRLYYDILPNLKIASIYPDVLSTMEVRKIHDQDNRTDTEQIPFIEPEFSDKIYRQLINTFILSTICNLHKPGLLVDITFLVPNVYDQMRVSRLRRAIENDMHLLITSNNLQEKVLGYEIHILSESDAAFLGTIKEKSLENTIKENDFVLTIDCGKGTTDFSIVKKNLFGTFDSIYRGGIPGAGNTITYAFFETVAHMLRGVAGKRWLLDTIVHAPLDIQLDIIKKVENLKKNFIGASENITSDILKARFKERGAREDYNESNSVDQLDFVDKLRQTLQLLSDKNASIKDEFGFIAEAVTQLANNVVSSIQKIENLKPFKYLIISGRGFLFNPLDTEIQRLLSESKLYKYGESNVIQGSDLKTVSIKGSVDSTSINYDSGIIGIPLHFVKKKGFLNLVKEIGSRGQLNHNSNTLELMFQSENSPLGLLEVDTKSSKYQIGTSTYTAKMEDRSIDTCSILFNGDSFILKELQNNTSVSELKFESKDTIADHHSICIKSLYPFLHNSNLILPLSNLASGKGGANGIYDIFNS